MRSSSLALLAVAVGLVSFPAWGRPLSAQTFRSTTGLCASIPDVPPPLAFRTGSSALPGAGACLQQLRMLTAQPSAARTHATDLRQLIAYPDPGIAGYAAVVYSRLGLPAAGRHPALSSPTVILPSRAPGANSGTPVYTATVLGFSADSRLAYFHEVALGGCDACLQLTIVDLVTDQPVFTLQLPEGALVGGRASQARWVDEAVRLYGAAFSGILDDYGIRHTPGLRLARFPSPIGLGGTHDAYLGATRYPGGRCNGDCRIEADLVVTASGLGVKRIGTVVASLTTARSGQPGIEAVAAIEGYLRSPFEDRIAVVTSSYGCCWGSEQSWGVRIFGAHLTTGYR